MSRVLQFVLAGAVALGLIVAAVVAYGWWGSESVREDAAFIVPQGATLTSIADKLEEEGHIRSADAFLLRAKVLGGNRPIKAGEFQLTAGSSQAGVLDTLQGGDVIDRFVTIPEGMPSILVHDTLMGEELLTGEIEVPVEGSILPDTYSFERGEARADVVKRMQVARDNFLAEAWGKRKQGIAVDNPRDALILAGIVEKETGKPEERRMVAGLYSNRLKQGMMLQADPTIIYPITKGKPLGRRIRQSEIQAVNDYNTYTMTGLPRRPITNPGREAIEAVLDPAETDALYMVADGSGGHAFASTLEQHNANVEKWFAIRRERGEM